MATQTSPNLFLLQVSGIYPHEDLNKGELLEWGKEVYAACLGRLTDGGKKHARVGFYGFTTFDDVVYAYATLNNRSHKVQPDEAGTKAVVNLSCAFALDARCWLNGKTLLDLPSNHIVWVNAHSLPRPPREPLALSASPVVAAFTGLLSGRGAEQPSGWSGAGHGQGGSKNNDQRGRSAGGAATVNPHEYEASVPQGDGVIKVLISAQRPFLDYTAADSTLKILNVPRPWLPLRETDDGAKELVDLFSKVFKASKDGLSDIKIYDSIAPTGARTKFVSIVVGFKTQQGAATAFKACAAAYPKMRYGEAFKKHVLDSLNPDNQ
ncbi:hypothetical protein JCM10207_000191 [Rhodosporidiobolus poonsookiae]